MNRLMVPMYHYVRHLDMRPGSSLSELASVVVPEAEVGDVK